MPYPKHWSYYMSLEDELIETEKYVELCEDNFDTFSTQFTRLLLAAASEVDVVAKQLCSQIAPTAKFQNINEYQKIIATAFPAVPKIVLGIQWNPVRISPWASWAMQPASSPDWWRAYNGVKHERDIYFKSGNLQNAINAVGGLYCLILHLDENKNHVRPDRFLRVASSS
jgi:hypothetical protein